MDGQKRKAYNSEGQAKKRVIYYPGYGGCGIRGE